MTEFADPPNRFAGKGLACIRGERLVFTDLDFEIATGGAIRLTGPNGSGKSSLLRVLAGLGRVASGAMYWNDIPVSKERDAHRGRVLYIGHQEPIKPWLSVAENLFFWAALYGKQDVDARVAKGLDLVALEHLGETPGRYLSAGQRRRLSLARIVACPLPVWLLDEPTVGLDRDSVAAVERAIATHRETGGMVIAATHIPIAMPDADELRLSPAKAAA